MKKVSERKVCLRGFRLLICAVLTVVSVMNVPLQTLCADNEYFIAFGDSITAGYRLEAPDDPGYVRYCDANYGKSRDLYVNKIAEHYSLDIYNYAVSGYTSEDLLNLIRRMGTKQRAIVNKSEFIVISIGGNDLLKILNEETISLAIQSKVTGVFRPIESIDSVLNGVNENYRKTIGLLSEIAPDVMIYGQTMYNPFIACVGGIDLGDIFGPYIEMLNDVFEQIANDYPNFSLVDVSPLNENTDSYYRDADIHPTVIGHASIAECYIEAIDSKKDNSTDTVSSVITDVGNTTDKVNNETETYTNADTDTDTDTDTAIGADAGTVANTETDGEQTSEKGHGIKTAGLVISGVIVAVVCLILIIRKNKS